MKKSPVWLTLTLLGSLALSACSSGSTSAPAGDEATGGEGTAPPASTDSKQVEIFSWWTGAGEEAGLKALIQVFKDKQPSIEVINAAVAGGAGTNAKAVLASRMQGGDPPWTFQVHGGSELNSGWVAAGKMEPLNELYEAEGWNDKFPQDLIDLVSSDGSIWSVPVNIHRGNVLWYNKKVFDDNGLTVPTTFDEFFAAADALKAKGITPLALGDKEPWAATHLFETVLLGTLGADGYRQLWTGDLSFDDPKVKEALETFKRMLTYVNEDHAARNWQDASQLVSSGEAAMNVMGDWAKGYFTGDLKLEVGVDFGYAPTPGTDGSFMVITDTFGLPTGVKDPESVKEFLKVLGSVEGQDAFNPEKGSIPARIDADVEKYDVYGKETIEDFKNSALTPSLAHGSAASEGFLTQANQVINIFVTGGDVEQAVQGLKSAASQGL
ncbi:ABC transporter substrate-binding protein [Paenibacillus sp. FSL H7-0326]|uniref:ABC transporter substrate-binding protein n=1 Tax=Paenibacillus sp. FSL H7-0326 TaxID=1921144 RepID=UPI00096DE8B8|nr:ABC transporter substrate-binding protein [Paenibacillus sp. FSL H7-0326]OMC72228.1 ABC transporter substrate-binding protein [Paenibacillus sp. FSL H7-0326]